MANIKFSAFTAETDPTQIDFLAGYQGATMKRIAPNNISTGLPYLYNATAESLYGYSIPVGQTNTSFSNVSFGVETLKDLTLFIQDLFCHTRMYKKNHGF